MQEIQKVLEDAISFYGERNQVTVAQEECAELVQALSKYLRGKPDYDNIHEEIADVEIMTSQLKIIFDCSKQVEQKKAFKVSRLNHNIKSTQSMRY